MLIAARISVAIHYDVFVVCVTIVVQAADLDKTKPIITYCQSGMRAVSVIDVHRNLLELRMTL